MIDRKRISCRGWSIDVICSPADGDDARLNLGRFDGAQIHSFGKKIKRRGGVTFASKVQVAGQVSVGKGPSESGIFYPSGIFGSFD